jgi:hypothetical protein
MAQTELQRLDTEGRSFRLNPDFVYPKEKLDEIKQNYIGKEFFEEDYDPEKYDYKLDKDGRVLLDVEGNPVKKDKSILRSIIETVPPTIRQGLDVITNSLSVGSLPENPMPKVIQTTQAKDPNTNLTRTQQALLSPTEQVIAARKIT